MSAHLRPSPRLGVGYAEPPDNAADDGSVPGNEGTFVVFGEDVNPGRLSGWHCEGRGFEVLYSCQEVTWPSSLSFLRSPSVASIPKSISILASLTTLIALFEAPVF